MDSDHNILYMVNILAACLMFVVAMIFNGLAASSSGGKLFQNSTGAVSAYYYTDITPAGWTFSIWGVIYAWIALFLVYSVSLIFRRSTYGRLYVSPGHQPPLVYALFSATMVANIAWLLLWDRFMPGVALLFILLGPVLTSAMLFVSLRALFEQALRLQQDGLMKDVWLTRMLTHNSIGLYCTWTTIATFINLDVVIIYVAGYEVTLAGTICLCLIFFDFITWFFVDNFLIDKYTRYIFTPYLTYLVGVSGSLVNNWDLTKNNSVLSAFLLAAVILGTILKFTIMIYRHFKVPIYPPEDEVTMFLESSTKRDYGSVKYEPISDA